MKKLNPGRNRLRFTSTSAAASSPASAEGMSLRLEGKTEGKPASSTVLTLDKPGATEAPHNLVLAAAPAKLTVQLDLVPRRRRG